MTQKTATEKKPGGRKKRPAPFLKLGKIEVTKIDAHNWEVSGDGRVSYFPTLSWAIEQAALRAADSKATTAEEWLIAFEGIALRITQAARKLEAK